MPATLERRLGVVGIVLMVVAAAAPFTVVAANFPIIYTVSESVGAPLMVLVATCILLLFSVGYAWMSPHVPDAGAFYSYVDRGLGRRAGLGTAAVALLSYVLLTVSITAYLGVQASNLVELWTSVTLPWWLISGAMVGVVAVLGFRDIELSAKVLGVVLVVEVVAVLAIDVGVLLSGRELTAQPFTLAEGLSGAPGLGLLFAFLGFFGFEATAVFRHEARDPERTVPRATYLAVLTIGVLYTVSSWLVVVGLGADDAVAASAAAPDRVIIDLTRDVVGPMLADVAQVLVVTSMFACMLAFHNIVTRYLFTLGERRVLPAALARVHAEHRSPAHASLWVTGITATIIVVSALARLDPVLQIYTWYSGAGALGIIVMMALTSLAVLGYSSRRRRDGSDGAPPWVVGAAVLGGTGLLLVLAISLWNLPVLVGGNAPAVVWASVLAATFVLGALAGRRASRVDARA